ncbi:MAG: hypothetical protein J5766_04345 [Clostridia bacterium]|nr:hypothetical protein [Clostridia bacterium]
MARENKKTKGFALSGGMDNSGSREDIDDKKFYFAKNMVYEYGALRARKGLAPIGHGLIGNHDALGNLKTPLTVTDTPYSYSGVSGKLGYDIWSDGATFAFVNVYLFRDNMTVRVLGTITVNMVSGQFFLPKSIVFLTGNAVHGNGLYVFLCCTPGTETYDSGLFEIYEFSGSNLGFTHVSDSDFYVPVLYTNGRGNNFNEARRNGWVYEETPQYPEDVNLLTEQFKAFFTSDGYSSGFKLPVWQLDGSLPSFCRIYENADNYVEWILPPETQSSTINYNGYQITATLDCSTGYLRFTNNGSDYAIPKSQQLNGNNVMIVSHKYILNCRKAVLSSKGGVLFEDKIYLYGNGFYRNEIYCSASDNPLYFPESMKTTVGNFNEGVNALHAKGKTLFAFKNDGIFKISSNEQISKTDMVLPIDVGRNYQITNRLKSTELSEKIGCSAIKTIKNCGNKTIFLAQDKKIYCISDNGITAEISAPVNGLLSGLPAGDVSNAFAVRYGHNYLIFIGNHALVVDFENTEFGFTEKLGNRNGNSPVKWYYLVFPSSQGYTSGIETGGHPYIICTDRNRKVSYICGFSGDKDRIPDPTAQEPTTTDCDIEFELETKSFDLDDPTAKKSILSADLFLSGHGNFKIGICGDRYRSDQTIVLKGESVVKIYPFLLPSYAVSADISGKAPFSVSKFSLVYKSI